MYFRLGLLLVLMNTSYSVSTVPLVDERSILSLQRMMDMEEECKTIHIPVLEFVMNEESASIKGEHLTSETTLMSRQGTHSSQRKKIRKNNKNFECLVCGKQIHTGERPYHCHLCSWAFKTSSDLKSHVTTHSKEAPFGCDFCEKRFTRASGLRNHVKRMHDQL
ncbi:unnamed protein product [Cyprideis torosa]|uniref:Uncharacterized protein n=1 Tax=Cyprideis torosa TaxID=163714 RepID=A0A7R8WG71_9CRUS|nr:unnamed protein product [Cyprideis torosa]CAG0897853.1 unnamed protein product [Cyprideis torosa]